MVPKKPFYSLKIAKKKDKRAFWLGFTLVEAILTIAIIGVLAAITLPRFVKGGFFEGLALRTAVSQIASDIRYTRTLAIANCGHYLINFNCTAKEYSIYKNSISLANRIGEIKKISSDVVCLGTSQFDFYNLGNCVFSGQGLSLNLSTGKYNIKVESPTGAVLVEKSS
jgi:prepilin-type N-terminal cleavage/methylation domain-containing protein